MKTQHTPGPWELEFTLDGGIFIKAGTKYIASIESETGKPTEEDKANARLLKAAPELLETCKELLKAYHDNNFAWALPLTNTAVFDRAKDAIQKATK